MKSLEVLTIERIVSNLTEDADLNAIQAVCLKKRRELYQLGLAQLSIRIKDWLMAHGNEQLAATIVQVTSSSETARTKRFDLSLQSNKTSWIYFERTVDLNAQWIGYSLNTFISVPILRQLFDEVLVTYKCPQPFV